MELIPTGDLQLLIMASQMCVLENEMEARKDKLRELLGLGFDRVSPEIETVKEELRALYDAFKSQETEYLELQRSLEC